MSAGCLAAAGGGGGDADLVDGVFATVLRLVFCRMAMMAPAAAARVLQRALAC